MSISSNIIHELFYHQRPRLFFYSSIVFINHLSLFYLLYLLSMILNPSLVFLSALFLEVIITLLQIHMLYYILLNKINQDNIYNI